MADVFLSYHVTDETSALVRGIADELESMGISCWYAPRNVRPGAFVQSIREAIRRCKAFVMILDEGANGPGYVYNEMLLAFNRFKKERHPEIIPFKLGTFETDPDIAFYLAPFHTFDGGASANAAHTAELIRKTSELFGKAPAKIVKRGECGDSVTYTLDENGVLTIAGNGPMWNFAPYKAPWWDERQTISIVRIQNGVTSIEYFAFEGCTRLTSVVIPNSVTEIGWGAFGYCTGLTSVVIPDSVTEIGAVTFSGCKNLRSVVIPDNVNYIGELSFNDCKNLKSVSVPVKAKIEVNAFPSTVRVERRA